MKGERGEKEEEEEPSPRSVDEARRSTCAPVAPVAELANARARLAGDHDAELEREQGDAAQRSQCTPPEFPTSLSTVHVDIIAAT